MSHLFEDIAREFPEPSLDAWRRGVEKALKGRTFADALIIGTPEGLTLQPLYVGDDLPDGAGGAVPAAPPYTRGFPAPGANGPRIGWVRSAVVEHPDARTANALLLDDLAGGVERVVAEVVPAASALAAHRAGGLDLAGGRGGVWLDAAEDIAALTAGVHPELAAIALRTRDLDLLSSLLRWTAEGRGPADLGPSAQFDVIERALSGDPSPALASLLPLLAAEARRAGAPAGDGVRPALRACDARPFLLSARGLRLAGADVAQEVAAVLGAFVGLARAWEAAGHPRADLVRACEFELVAGSDFFTEIAKLRAFRRCLAAVLEGLGVAGRVADVLTTAVTAEETLTTRDVHLNLVRGTGQAVAAALGGADAIAVLPFDLRVNGGGPLGRRMARNLHPLMAEESGLDAVVDAAGGAFYIEHRTEALARAAWEAFTAWEAAGGFFQVAASGAVRTAVDARWQQTARRLRSRKDPVLGVSVFALAHERRPDGAAFEPAAFVDRWAARLGTRAAAADPAPLSPALPSRVRSAVFEDLRDRADRLAASGSRPAVLAALVGEPAAYAARLDWIRDLFAAGGLELVERPIDVSGAGVADLPAGRKLAGAVLVAPDALHETAVPAVAAALGRQGLASILLAGRPGEREAAYREAGVTGFIFLGADVCAVLDAALERAAAV